MKFDISEQDNRNLSDDDENMTRGVDSFWGLEKIQPKEQKPYTASSSVEEKEITEKNMTDVTAPANKEKNVIRTEKNYNTKTDKNNNEYLQKIWGQFMSSVKMSPLFEFSRFASPYKIQNGIFQISVPSQFSEDMLKKYKDEIFEILVRFDNTITGVKISSSFNINYFTRIHNRIIADNTINNSAFRVYCALVTYRNNATNHCYIGLRQLSTEWGFSTSTIQSALKLLQKQGYIKRQNKNYRFPLLEETEKNGK